MCGACTCVLTEPLAVVPVSSSRSVCQLLSSIFPTAAGSAPRAYALATSNLSEPRLEIKLRWGSYELQYKCHSLLKITVFGVFFFCTFSLHFQ